MVRNTFLVLTLLPFFGACSASPQQIERQIQRDLKALDQAVSQYTRIKNEYPDSLSALTDVGGRNLLADGTSLQDPYGNPYGYTSPAYGGSYDLYSLGSDGSVGGEDENADVSWQALRHAR